MFFTRLVHPSGRLDQPSFGEVLLNTAALGSYVRRRPVPVERGAGFLLFGRREATP